MTVQKQFRILIINPKTEKTIISVFHHEKMIYNAALPHQTDYGDTVVAVDKAVAKRKEDILQHLIDAGINISRLHGIAANGGLLRAIEGGTYIVNEAILHDLRHSYNGKHASNLGGLIAFDIAKGLNIPAFIVDPPVVDELGDLAKITGHPHIERKSIFHALNQKAVARQAANELKKTYEKTSLIVAHLGHGITIGAHQCGKVIDVNNGLHGDGPFSLERAGTLPSEALIELCFSGKYSKDDIIYQITYEGGLKAYLQTEDLTEIENKIANDNQEATQIYSAMAYQIAKEIGALAAVLQGKVDGIVLTGDLAYSSLLTDLITESVHWIADIFIYPGEYDIQALNEGALRVLRGEEAAKHYRDKQKNILM